MTTGAGGGVAMLGAMTAGSKRLALELQPDQIRRLGYEVLE